MRVTLDADKEVLELVDRRASERNIPWSTAATHLLELGARVWDNQYDMQSVNEEIKEKKMDRQEAAKQEAEVSPVMEVHLGEIRHNAHQEVIAEHIRYCIIWINGKRWEGDLVEVIPDH